MRLAILSCISFLSVSSLARYVAGFASVPSRRMQSTRINNNKSSSLQPHQSQSTHISTTTILKAESDVYTSGVHHTAIRSKDIENAIKFYSLLSFEVEEKFLIGGTVRCAWLKNVHSPCRIELIEVPEDMLGAPKELVRAADQLKKTSLLGLNHLCLDVTQSIKARQALEVSDDDLDAEITQYFSADEDGVSTSVSSTCSGDQNTYDHRRNSEYGLGEWLTDLEGESKEMFGKTLRIAMGPTTRTIGKNVYDLAFLYDADGALVELLNHVTTRPETSESGWEKVSDEDFMTQLQSLQAKK
uniref:VOC domain-containing protein n=1 Tax=Leptocylindrus danicus TaxID=163516 RepID=A0A7S2NZB2_9STRA|mmetsp:Transcript_18038/g.26823  ORF Transcript_18038/g.26823 Transcript_18038/m.26823 type:complete len:300 (+) Transcript_18038:103-1002(+)|eukprot:CAMPEP_0116012686 /NCGR_PEP_ID=MMETSP0321-20121206/5264_1 /TAXON_ID=163516 /ORGANISM="Leptocylindrus danicus var. danicus, Strain B650" /LENGTH=299 /DNA_ID=CAMNT_0003482063 /DNA_START=80 /DNA_END=979 /DNA_ORIENTATION=-